MGIEVKGINKRFKDRVILDDVNLIVETGELVALLGPSGSGKTSLLRVIAGLEFADSGIVLLDGEETQIKPIRERNVGFVFQHYALFKHMTVFENATFGLKVRSKKERPSRAAIKKKINGLLELMHLEGYEDHYPFQLSGGQQQRVALVRALAVDPKVLLLDEPFGALDANVRKELCRWIRTLHDEIKVSSIFVTHDQEEALEVADRVGIMNKGKIIQVGTPAQIWRQPSDQFVFSFLGHQNEFDGWVDEKGKKHLQKPISVKRTTKLYARPYDIVISREPFDESIRAKITHINSTGSLVRLEVISDTKRLWFVEISHEEFDSLSLKKGYIVFLKPKKTYEF